MKNAPQLVEKKQTRYLLSDLKAVTCPRVTCFASCLLVWLLVSLLFPLPTVASTLYSFQIEVLALPQERPVLPLSERVLARLEKLEKEEIDPWLRDDLRIAWITTLYASQGNKQPFVDATYRVLGLHPDKVWPAILQRRAAILGKSFGLIGADAPPTSQRAINPVGELSPKKPCTSERDPRRRKAA